MGFGFNTDLNMLSALTSSALIDNSNDTDIALRSFGSSLNSSINGSYFDNSASSVFTDANGNLQLNPTTAAMAKYATSFSPDQFGTITTSAFLTPATAGNMDATNTLQGLNMGLDLYLNKAWTSLEKFSNDLSRLNLGVNIPGGLGSSSTNVNGTSTFTPSQSLDKKLQLIDEYCNKTGKDIDTDAIRTKYAMNPDAGVKYCDSIIRKFDSKTVKSIVNSLYKEDLKTKAENGKSISDSWVKSVQDATFDKPSINTFGLNSSNILDVIAAFISNKDVLNGSVKFKDIFKDKNVYNQIAQTLVQKANEMLGSVSNEVTKRNIRTKLRAVKSTTTSDKINAFYQLYDVLRNAETVMLDKNAYTNYGASNLGSSNEAHNQYASQKSKYEHRRVLKK